MSFYWRRLHSLLGVIPVGLFLVFHLSLNFTAVGGEELYNNAIGVMELVPHCVIVSYGMGSYLYSINVPRVLWNLYCIYCNTNTKRFSTFRNWMFCIQRITGIFLVIFVAWHMFQTRIQKALGAEVRLQYDG